jgi:hypothetical protein
LILRELFLGVAVTNRGWPKKGTTLYKLEQTRTNLDKVKFLIGGTVKSFDLVHHY